ncbi:3-oxoacyl-ACP synthase III family protein [Streptomyces sp. URMC 126]|uniref:3-oxoacyl-ACP synthase III family protein n=1 Tax=Streptomyces sp. URMC 126 TaxID=3423401 RepID=UPI003F1CC5F8
MTTEELEDLLQENSPDFLVPRGMIRRVTGVTHRYVSPAGRPASDLAAAAAGKALADAGWNAADLDLLVFAAVTGDMLEPATAHAVAVRIGARCPVFDVKNACNSVLSGLEAADALIRTGAYRRVLVCCGETPTHVFRLLRSGVSGPRQFLDAMAAYTISDAGAAVLLEAAAEPGILGFATQAISSEWAAGAVPFAWEPLAEARRPRFEPGVMARAVRSLVARGDPFHEALGPGGSVPDTGLYCVHLPSVAFVDEFRETLGIPPERLMATIGSHGNTAAATLPLQLDLALREGRLHRDDIAALVGFASGVSLGVLWLRL